MLAYWCLKIKFGQLNNRGFSYKTQEFNPCLFEQIITSYHGFNPSDLKSIWNLLNQENMSEKCKPLTRKDMRSYDPGVCTWRWEEIICYFIK